MAMAETPSDGARRFGAIFTLMLLSVPLAWLVGVWTAILTSLFTAGWDAIA